MTQMNISTKQKLTHRPETDIVIPILFFYKEAVIAWKQNIIKFTWGFLPKCPLTEEWIKKIRHIYTVEYYSDIKRNQFELFVEEDN